MSNEENNFGDAFVYSCLVDKAMGHEQFVPKHAVSFQISGETHIDHQQGTMILKEGQLMIAHRNQLAKAFKYPGENREYRSVSVMLDTDYLKKYAVEHHIATDHKYSGDPNILLEPDSFIQGYFSSLIPYLEHTKEVNPEMEAMKVNEMITLLLKLHPVLKTLLFDFSTPYKIDLEAFMVKNYQYNVPIENFARLTGRSLASFKRDFEKVFGTSPRKWLKEKRLVEAYYLIEKKQQKPADIYLDLGFENLSHFYSSFKEKFGITPATIYSKQNDNRTVY
ncbi:helix-turn-helix domain-containing protein [Chitinophaga arvensicola]|uniref:AraC-type DNA-binding protein n=1 Tax=Chitinophaga arvensicola TaxID=29529 RepID=A0A1I0S4K3_9BACT|nr:AraC family transcriptional regulator [Chitinophaga arvensicola]SEW49622.1 AraC-type DNA-binding protein [Chitinophaga arvensicola]